MQSRKGLGYDAIYTFATHTTLVHGAIQHRMPYTKWQCIQSAFMTINTDFQQTRPNPAGKTITYPIT